MSWKIPDLADCKPGIYPTEYNVLIAVAEFQERSSGGIILTARTQDQEQHAVTRGRLVAVSPLAFTFAKPEEWGDGRRPQPGDAVLTGRYAGEILEGKDGRKYRLC